MLAGHIKMGHWNGSLVGLIARSAMGMEKWYDFGQDLDGGFPPACLPTSKKGDNNVERGRVVKNVYKLPLQHVLWRSVRLIWDNCWHLRLAVDGRDWLLCVCLFVMVRHKSDTLTGGVIKGPFVWRKTHPTRFGKQWSVWKDPARTTVCEWNGFVQWNWVGYLFISDREPESPLEIEQSPVHNPTSFH